VYSGEHAGGAGEQRPPGEATGLGGEAPILQPVARERGVRHHDAVDAMGLNHTHNLGKIGIGDVAKVIIVKVDVPRRELSLAVREVKHRGSSVAVRPPEKKQRPLPKSKKKVTYYDYYSYNSPSAIAERQSYASTFDETKYYERDSRKIPFGTAEWWRQMEREGKGRKY
jgi:hypothetical protein